MDLHHPRHRRLSTRIPAAYLLTRSSPLVHTVDADRAGAHAPQLATPLAAPGHDLQRDGSAHHHLEAAIRTLWRARRCTTSNARHRPSALPSSSPHHRPRAQHATLTFLATHAAFIASPRTATLSSSVPPSPLEPGTCRAPWHHPHHLPRLQRAPWLFPIASAAVIASSCGKRIFNKQDYPSKPAPHRLHRPDHLSTCRHRFQRFATLHSKPAPVRYREYAEHHRSTQQGPRDLTIPQAALIAAAPTSPPCRAANAPWQIAPPYSSIPGLRARGTCPSF
ncbi:hypothetical protein DFH08DRAFT_1001372 [Mycena albidolilacea]|uniref:Uncharacterized protein n=1 Tax=Mycena albidolilacea TaxID=1033008 RepID=A0AAD7A210_9AGAR|nr:hypothetical protein DFH08DRAFT_1001372 [Mycena albidolilacea]